MGKIKKLLENELVGGTQSSDIYPVTSVKAVYDEDNERLDNIINRRGVVNISTNYNSDHTAEVLTLEQAIAKVPLSDRVLGFQGKFLTSEGWKSYMFVGDSLSNWSDTSKWIELISSEAISQESGNSTSKVMSQAAVTKSIAELEEKNMLNFFTGILSEDSLWETVNSDSEEKKLIRSNNLSIVTSPLGGYAFRISNESSVVAIYINCVLVTTMDSNWTNNVLENSEGDVINKKPLYLSNQDLILIIPPKHTLTLISVNKSIRKITGSSNIYKSFTSLEYIYDLINKGTSSIDMLVKNAIVRGEVIEPSESSVNGWVTDTGEINYDYNIVHNIYNVSPGTIGVVWTKNSGTQNIGGHQGIVQFFNDDSHIGTALYADESGNAGDYILIVPDGCNKICVNLSNSFNPEYYYLSSIGNTQNTVNRLNIQINENEKDIKTLTTELNNTKSEIDEVKEAFTEKKLISLTASERVKGIIVAKDGTLDTSFGDNYLCDVYNIEPNIKYYLSCTGSAISGNSYALAAFYKEDGTYISNSAITESMIGGADDLDNYEIVSPPDASIVKISVFNNRYTYVSYNEYVNLVNENKKDIESITEDLSSTKSNVDIQEFEMLCCKNRCKKLENVNPFEYKEFDKSYIVLTIDDANNNLPKMYDLCIAMSIPLSPAVPFSTLTNKYTTGYNYESNSEVTVGTRSVKDICNAIVENGGEILSHNSKVIGVNSPTEKYIEIFRDSKYNLENEGFKIRGIILSGGTDIDGDSSISTDPQVNEKCQGFSQMYYDYSDLYGKKEPYRHRRFYMWSYPVTSYEDVSTAIEAAISDISTKIENKELIVIGMHGSTESNSIENVKNMRTFLEKIKTQFVDTAKAEFTIWGKVYDKFASTQLEKRLSLLENSSVE